jgi:alginate O-acetyltransferase complex protein AlgI
MLLTFCLTAFAWVFFRAKTVAEAFDYIKNMFRFNFEGGIQFLEFERYSIELLLLLGLFILVEWTSREQEHPIMGKWARLKVLAVVTTILVLGVYSSPTDFIYFQF